jgi:hypothetical protein
MISHRFVHSGLLVAGTVLAGTTAFAQTAAPAPSTASTTTSMASTPSTGSSVTASASVTASPEQAPPSPDAIPIPADATMQYAVSGFAGVGYGWGLGVGYGLGARFQYDFLPKGVLHLPHGMHDEMGIEAGLDFFHVSTGYLVGDNENYNEFTPLAGWVWNFWLTDKLAVYPKLDVGYRIGLYSYTDSTGKTVSVNNHDVFPVYFEGAAGVVYKVGPVALRGEVGWEALRVGIGVNL